jgi:hypothetical protein
MMKQLITIKQSGRACVVLCGDDIVFGGGRVAAKKFAMTLHESTGYAVYNIKDGGLAVVVLPAQDRTALAPKTTTAPSARQGQ